MPGSPGSHYRYLTQNTLHLMVDGIQHIHSITPNIRRTPVHKRSQVMLCDQIDRKIMSQQLDIRIFMNFFEQCTLDFKSSNIFVMKHSVFGRSEEHTSELQSLMRISY